MLNNDICDDLYVIANGKTYLTKSLDDLEALGYISEKALMSLEE